MRMGEVSQLFLGKVEVRGVDALVDEPPSIGSGIMAAGPTFAWLVGAVAGDGGGKPCNNR